jgi:hypothetical protein
MGIGMVDGSDKPRKVFWACDWQVAEDLSCVNCGYNLRTLSSLGVCPECGVAVARSLEARGQPTLRQLWPRFVAYLAANLVALHAPGILVAAIAPGKGLLRMLGQVVFAPTLLPRMLLGWQCEIPEFVGDAVSIALDIVIVGCLTWYCVMRAERPRLVPLMLFWVSLADVLIFIWLAVTIARSS